MNMHTVRTTLLHSPDCTPQSLFEDVVSHSVDEDSRGYQTLFAAIIRNLLTTDWIPVVDPVNLPSFQTKRRAGYLIEFAARKMLDREKKRVLFSQTAMLRSATEDTPYTTLYPNPSNDEYSMTRNTDELAREWGLLDGATRSNILKMLKDE